ncbi:MAG TPA: hypothetical protein VNK82_07110 [Terriglobales bacterium]|nr:hypothetical protein [Terriglobales bacterium]
MSAETKERLRRWAIPLAVLGLGSLAGVGLGLGGWKMVLPWLYQRPEAGERRSDAWEQEAERELAQIRERLNRLAKSLEVA